MSQPGDAVALISGLPGAMGFEVAAACLRKGITVAPYSFTGPGIADKEVQVSDGEGGASMPVQLVQEGDRDRVAAEMVAKYGDNLVVIDFTHPSAVNGNAKFYCKHKLAFVMGTTGGDREELHRDVDSAGIWAVIAANMSKQIVALQATMEHMATEFPGCFEGYKLNVVESHQKTKADTSGTAKDMVKSFVRLNASDFTAERDIVKLRTDEDSKAFGVPEEGLNGHAFHTYKLTSGDGSVEFQFQHNVVGRRTYADGVADAVNFLYKARKENSGTKKVFNMIDILKSGSML